ncbi:MAG TPA: flagellar basal body L-ring protein FlgH [Firmicutes bacterium]|uniref:Flagellar basal body L-ring protein FlgH n=1 Tax=Capillibacterium thermochitinicola TaxID=2699427 RepID=A0A8J6I2E1_9FIRM|nr:flagellar basal body L-ring protein FlgH [Capillibacterium thermochitinicola]MBA2133012.1 flagellar basal body L-ring protein FlgH [Capillibacterium thermochitinicola]HHW13015.1 flagellar basal body L-ring protein FlgH [Bacillota bacterium]
MKRIVLFSLVGILLLAAAGVEASSLWTEESGSYFIKPRREFRVGDLLTIVISEQSQATSKTGVNSDEGSSIVVGPGAGLLTDLLPYLKGSVSTSYDGATGTNKAGSLKAQLTVRIVAIDANGNLCFEGSKEIMVNRDLQRLTFSGVVRPEDVGRNNTVLSTYVAEAKIDYVGNDYATQKGLLTRAFEWLF